MKKIIAFIVFCISTSAFAWGDREQGILTGIALYHLHKQTQQHQHSHVRVVPEAVYVVPAHRHVYPSYYTCLVQVYDPITNTHRNEAMTCVR